MNLKRVVVTGLGSLTPISNAVSGYQKLLLNGVSGADLITRFNTSLNKTEITCEIKTHNFDISFEQGNGCQYASCSQYDSVRAVRNADNYRTLLDKGSKREIDAVWLLEIG